MNPDTEPTRVINESNRSREREALEDSERRAATSHPDNYKEEATDSKVVEIGPDLTDAPIEGLDPADDAKP